MELGYTQEEVSDMIGMNKGYVSNVESKTAFTPSFGAAIKWLAALDGTMRIDWGNDGRDRHHETDSPE